MPDKTISHSALTELVTLGTVQSAHVVGQAGGWSVYVELGSSERALAAQRSRQVRLFKRMETVVSYLKDVGISRFDVDAAHYEPSGDRTFTRPDRSEALKNAHAAAAHDQWFRQQVEDSLATSRKPSVQWIDHEVVRADMAQQRAALIARTKGEDA